jgi:hypothetical protein
MTPHSVAPLPARTPRQGQSRPTAKLRRAGRGGVNLLSLIVVAASAAAQEAIPIPADAPIGVFVNVWAETYDGGSKPTFRPAGFLEPDTNYRVVVDVAAIPYGDAGGRNRVVSVPITNPALEAEPGPLLMQILVEDERYPPAEGGDGLLSVHGYRASLVGTGWRQRLSSLSFAPVQADALSLLRPTAFRPPWVFARGMFLVRARGRTGQAPLGVLFRKPVPLGHIFGVISTRFCITKPERSPECHGLPRRSEHLEYRVQSRPPATPSDDEIEMRQGYRAPSLPPWEPTKEWTWNSWLSRQGDPTRSPVEYLALDEAAIQSSYVLRVDASLYAYFALLGLREQDVGSAPADPLLRDLVQARLQDGDRTLRLVVRVEAIGSAIKVGRRVQTIEVDLTRLDPDRPPPLPSGPQSLGITELSAAVAAASIEVEVTPVAAGFGAIAFSLSDASGRRPVDHLVHVLDVRKASKPPPKLRSGGVQRILSSGIRGVLARGQGDPVDVALHVFELFPDLDMTAAAFLVGAGDDYHSWELARPLTEYLADPANLEARIRDARQLTRDGVTHAYDQAGRELAGALFSGVNPSEQRKADAALEALRKFVERSPAPPRVRARLTDARGELLFLPLGLLSAPGQAPIFSKPLNLVLPMPIEGFAETGCLGRWAVAVSDELEGSQVKVPDDVRDGEGWLGPSFESLRSYLREPRSADGEGVVLLAHHAGGRLRYRQTDFPLQAQEVKKAYGQPSAAVLAICGAGGANRVDSLLVRRLNEFGLDAAILSPFSLDANYGKVFAIEFSRIVRRARAAKRPASLSELFEETRAAAAASMETHSDPKVKGSVGDMGLELVLVGQPSLRLCKE